MLNKNDGVLKYRIKEVEMKRELRMDETKRGSGGKGCRGHRQTDRQTDREEREREGGRGRDRERQRERERERERGRQRHGET